MTSKRISVSHCRRITLPFLLIFLVLGFFANALAAQERLRLATTTSTDNSGLLAELHAPFEKLHGVKIDVIGVGTGKALRLGENGDVDVLMTHAPEAEISFVERGFGIERLPVMHNTFIILGPPDDPAQISEAHELRQALLRLRTSTHPFVSRGDDSGTHKKELALWDTVGGRGEGGSWYMAAGQGMGAVLWIADNKLAYTLSDRGTYLAYKDKIQLIPVFSGAPELLNPYHVIIVNPGKHPHVKLELAQKYVAFIRGETGQKIIASFKRNGERLFEPDVFR